MSRKIDFHNDPDAPQADRIVPAVNVVVINDAGEILLIRRTDNDYWALPGGVVDIGESLPQAALRETQEETGIDCQITGLSGIYTDPGHVILYSSNGEVRQEFSIVLTARATGGQPTPSSESSQVRWIAPADLDRYQMDSSMRIRVRHYAERRDQPYIG
jgi:ADP-ribose pyrophosphatase YjhB (NUDIX family)